MLAYHTKAIKEKLAKIQGYGGLSTGLDRLLTLILEPFQSNGHSFFRRIA